MSPNCRRCWLIAAAAACALTGAQAAIVEPMEQSFYFDYFRSTDLEPAPVPVTSAWLLGMWRDAY